LYYPGGGSEDWRSGRERRLGLFGSLEALQQAEKLGMQCSSYVAIGAAQSHCLPKLQWLLKTVAWMDRDIVSAAALGANIVGLRWLKTRDVKFYDKVPFNAYKHLHVLQYFVSEGCAVDAEEACYNAACCASVEVTQWAHAQGYAFPHDLIGIGAAMSGCLELVQWMYDEQNVRWDAEDLSYMLQLAGQDGALPLCKWLREHSAEWPPTLGTADCPWSPACLVWADSEGCDSPDYDPDADETDDDETDGVNGEIELVDDVQELDT
jgi:hypothetical protein